MTITYTSHPSRAVLLRGAFRTYFLVARDWAKLGLMDILIVAGLVGWAVWQEWVTIGAIAQPVQWAVLGAAFVCGLIIYKALGAALSLFGLWAGVHARPMPTTMTIVPGHFVHAADIAEHRFSWETLTAARAFPDMYILMFQTSPVHDVPVFVLREHLTEAQDDALARTLTPRSGRPVLSEAAPV